MKVPFSGICVFIKFSGILCFGNTFRKRYPCRAWVPACRIYALLRYRAFSGTGRE
jgi:hypothetical protein